MPPELEKALEDQSAELGISKSDLAREALRRYLRASEYRALRSRLIPRAQAQGLDTDEDVFKALADR
jgi:hypothetical protein